MLTVRNIAHLVMLHQEQSFVRAARKLGITQPALSRSIQLIEEEYGVVLFSRSRAKVVATAACLQLLPAAKQFLADSAAMDRNLRYIGKAEAGTVSFGMGPLIAITILPQLMERVLQERPGINMQIHVESGPEVIRRTLHNEVEFSCAADIMVPHHERVDRIPMARMPLALLARADHPLSHGHGSLEDYPLVGGAMLAEGSIPYNPRIQCDNYSLLKPVVLNSDAIWLNTPVVAREELTSGKMIVLPQKFEGPEQEIRIIMVRHRDRMLSPAADYIARLVRKMANEVYGSVSGP
ncbi:DNA-binding transcriptional LysR family regulator [Sphingobium sp. OAS761]|uniref:LysR family transcriptional regulator n=1 Tax=Sphingobium sp. OAS761 TaxID=2817901 RepID=UPI00209ED81F|nr:LysR family transcriptional regulator [Sphingobium sp. OAS761]MCP1471477.1 DNA-binding transcriptional LysR family regulator [Sphingobium sp. OAS761]